MRISTNDPSPWPNVDDFLEKLEADGEDIDSDNILLDVAEYALSKLNATQRECGCITAFDNFRLVLCNRDSYNLISAEQAREMLRFLCESEAFSEDTAQSKAAICEHLVALGLVEPKNDWRAHSPFKGNLQKLKKDAIGIHKTKGLYWIRP